MTANNIGIFGGTFNPVHKAHVAVAEQFINKFSLDILYVIPNNISPLKRANNVSGEDRKKMLEIAFSGYDKVVISDIELKREGTSYTRDTVSELRRLHPESKLFLLTGDDWINDFDKWKDYRFILENAELVVASRGGNDITGALDKLENICGKRPMLLGNERIELSSSGFRAEPDSSLLPDGVYDYIKKRELYTK